MCRYCDGVGCAKCSSIYRDSLARIRKQNREADFIRKGQERKARTYHKVMYSDSHGWVVPVPAPVPLPMDDDPVGDVFRDLGIGGDFLLGGRNRRNLLADPEERAARDHAMRIANQDKYDKPKRKAPKSPGKVVFTPEKKKVVGQTQVSPAKPKKSLRLPDPVPEERFGKKKGPYGNMRR